MLTIKTNCHSAAMVKAFVWAWQLLVPVPAIPERPRKVERTKCSHVTAKELSGEALRSEVLTLLVLSWSFLSSSSHSVTHM